MFVLGGLGALVVWHLRKALPESPRWLESIGRTPEADAILRAIEQEVSLRHAPLKPPVISSSAIQSRGLGLLLSPLLLPRMIVGATTLIVVNTRDFLHWLKETLTRVAEAQGPTCQATVA